MLHNSLPTTWYDENQAMILMFSLPKSYNTLVIQLEASPRGDVLAVKKGSRESPSSKGGGSIPRRRDPRDDNHFMSHHRDWRWVLS